MDAGTILTLLDVREPRERAFCTIAASPNVRDLHIPMREVPSHLEELDEAVARGPLVVYCHHGVRSMAVAVWLADRGLTGIVNLQGGIDAWSREVDSSVPQY
jgi:rhodanese-related sulfurtransferase